MNKHIKFCFIFFTLITLSSCAGNLEVRKRQSSALKNLGEAYLAQQDYTSALSEFLNAEKIYGKDPYLLDDLGRTYLAKGRAETAIEYFKKALKEKPDFSDAKNNLGSAYLIYRDWDMAIDTFKGMLGDLLYTTPHYPLSNLGFAWFQKGDYHQALIYYRKSLKVSPDYPVALLGLGKTYLALGMLSDGISVLEKAMEKAPGNPAIQLELGKAYLKSRQKTKAKAVLKRAVEFKGSSRHSREARALLSQIK